MRIYNLKIKFAGVQFCDDTSHEERDERHCVQSSLVGQ